MCILYAYSLVSYSYTGLVDESFVQDELKQNEISGELLRQQGIALKNKGQYDSAKEAYFKALTAFVDDEDSIGIGNVYNNLAYVFGRVGQNDTEIKYYYQSLQVFESIGNSSGAIKVNINLAGLYRRLSDFDKAIEHYYKAEQTLTRHKNRESVADVKMGLGNILSSSEFEGFNFEKARENYLSALNTYVSLNDSVNIGKVNNNLGWLHNEQGELESAIRFYQNSLLIKENIGDKAGQVVANLNIGSILNKQGRLEESLKYFRVGEQLAIEIGDVSNHLHILSNLVDVTAALGKVDTMTAYLNNYKTLKDSLFNKEKQKQISELQTLYETEQKERALVEEQKINEEKTTQNRWLIILAIALFIAIVITIILNERRKHALKNNAAKENKIAALNAHIVGQEEERERIANDLHDRVGSMLNNMKLMHSQYAHQGGDLGSKVESELASTSETIRELSHNLASATLMRHGLVAATNRLFETVNSASAVQAKLITKGLEKRLPQTIERVVDFCVHELVNNTLKYASATQIELQYLVNDNRLHMTYEDDGVGLDLNTIEYGIGLKSIEARVVSVAGKLTVNSNPGNGIMVDIIIGL